MATKGKINVLYISYDGMTDPLGQSQVIPYLEGLSKAGYQFTLLSFEKPERYETLSHEIAAQLKSSGIEWVPLSYTKRPPILSTLWDLYKMKRKAFALHRKKGFGIVHCRSYISSFVGLALKRNQGLKFIFDMRGFYADERVDGKIWNLSNPLFKFIFGYFKKKEQQFLSGADGVISLTHKGKDIIHSWKEIENQPIPIEVIPCCADLELFSPARINSNKQQELQRKFGLTGKEFVLSYLGSIGTWYMLDEMLDFFNCLLKKSPAAKFLFITNDSTAPILKKAAAKGIEETAFIFYSAKRQEVAAYLALSNYAIFFIQPLFSKAGSSPTKQGEIMGMQIPIVCNSGVGDVDMIVEDTNSGIVIEDFTAQSYNSAIDEMLSQKREIGGIREGAFKYYSLKNGIEKYISVYQKVLPTTSPVSE